MDMYTIRILTWLMSGGCGIVTDNPFFRNEIRSWNMVYGSRQYLSWWRHQMETFSVLMALFAGNSPVTDEFPSQRSVTWIFVVFFDLQLNKRLSKPTRRRWFETPLHSLWRHCNVWFRKWTPSVTLNDFNSCMDEYLHTLKSVRWNYLSIPTLQRLHR